MANSTSPVPQVVEGTNAVGKINEVLDMASQAMIGGRDASTTSLLTWGYLGGRISSADKASGTVALTASATNYVVMAKAGLAVSASTATTNWNDATNYWRLYSVVTNTTAATTYNDERFGTAGLFGVGGGGGGGTFTGGTLTSALNEAPPATIASSGTVAIGAAASNTVIVSGTTTITAFDTIAAGAIRHVRFSGALTLTHNGTTLILPAATNITTAAGDVAVMESLGSGNWRLQDYSKADGTALFSSGGGTLTGFTSALNTTGTNSATNASSLTASGGTTNQHIVLAPKGVGGLMAHIPDGAAAGGNTRGASSVDWQTNRALATAVASGTYAVIAGGSANTSSATGSTVGGGVSNVSNSSQSTVAGGSTNTASNARATVSGGFTNTASGSDSTVPGGNTNTASGDYSIATGRQATTRGLVGASAHASGAFSAVGDAQATVFLLRLQTTNATTASLSAGGAAPDATTIPILPNNSIYGFEAIVSAKVTTFGDRAVYKLVGAISRGANAAATQIDGTVTVTAIATIGGASAWVCTAIANTTLGGLEISVTGVAATTIKWVARVQTTEAVG